jgi:beta-lactamase regulating signal transducer with metallopeptidase domain
MNILHSFFGPTSSVMVERLGWILLHSLWQFALIAIVASAVVRFMKQSSAGLRYAVLVFLMAVCVTCPIATWIVQEIFPVAHVNPPLSDIRLPKPGQQPELQPSTNDDSPRTIAAQNFPMDAVANDLQSMDLASQSTANIPWTTSVRIGLRPWLPWIVGLWIVGVIICAMRPVFSWIVIGRLRRIGTSKVSEELLEITRRVSKRLGIALSVAIFQSSLVEVPLVVGYLRPMILLPIGLLSNLPMAQLEAIIAHELAHVRRHDFLANFLQTVVETLFFYHPAIWWFSKRIRIEREHCCDDLAIQVLGNRVEYGRALVAVEKLRGESSVLALSVADGSMLARVRRIVGQSGNGQAASRWTPLNILASCLIVVAISGLLAWQGQAQSQAQTTEPPLKELAQDGLAQDELTAVKDEPKTVTQFSDELKMKLTRDIAHQGKCFFIDLDKGQLKTPPFDVDIDTNRLPYRVIKPNEELVNDWLTREGVDLIVHSSIYRPRPNGEIERNEIQVRSVRTLLKNVPNGLIQKNDMSWEWTDKPQDVLNIFSRKDDVVHVSGFVPDSSAGDIRPDSPILRPFRTANNQLGLLLIEQPSSTKDELTLRIVHVANLDTPLADIQFGLNDTVSGLVNNLQQSNARQKLEQPFTASFPNNVRVEFVGLSRGVGDIQAAEKWWKPDGSPLEFAPVHRGMSGGLEDGKNPAEHPFVRTAIHVHGISDNRAVTVTSIADVADSAKDESGGVYVAHYGYADAQERFRTFEVGVATEALSPVRRFDRNGMRIPGLKDSLADHIAEDITIEKVGRESWGRKIDGFGPMIDPIKPSDQKLGRESGTTQVTLRFPIAWRNVDLRLFAIDKAGQSHGVDLGITLEANEENVEYIRLAKVIPVDFDEVDHFEYQFRIYRHWVNFENVSLWKGTNTEVIVKPQTIPVAGASNAARAQNATIGKEPVEPSESTRRARTNRVVDAQGKPIAGAKIDCLPSMKYSWLKPPQSLGSTESDSGGWFDYPEGLPLKDRFYVYVSADGFLERVFQANNGEAFVLENGTRKLDTLVLRRPVTVSGRIIGVDGKPLADAEIAVDYMYDNGWSQINGNRVKSDAEGRFVAKGLEPANLFVRYETPYKTNEERMPVGTQPGKLCIFAFTATDGQLRDDIVLDLSKCSCIVEGTIVDHEDKGVADRWITATLASAEGRLDESITAKSDAAGRFRFEGLTADEFVIGTYTPGFTETVKLSADRPTSVRLTTYLQGKLPRENDPNPPSYGHPSQDGIVGGLRIVDGDKHRLGDVITAEVLVKNKSDQVKLFAYSFAEQANLRVVANDELSSELNYGRFTGTTVTQYFRLEPNQEAIVGRFQIGLHDPQDKQNSLPKSTFHVACVAGQNLTLRCDMSANVFGRAGNLEGETSVDKPAGTGPLSFTVLQRQE